MIVKKEEKFKRLKESITDDTQISTKLLLMCGFSSTDITKLVMTGAIERVSRGVYKLIDKSILTDVGKPINTVNKENPIRKIFTSLQEGNLENAIKSIRNYLNDISKREYESFIVGLIKAAIKKAMCYLKMQ